MRHLLYPVLIKHGISHAESYTAAITAGDGLGFYRLLCDDYGDTRRAYRVAADLYNVIQSDLKRKPTKYEKISNIRMLRDCRKEHGHTGDGPDMHSLHGSCDTDDPNDTSNDNKAAAIKCRNAVLSAMHVIHQHMPDVVSYAVSHAVPQTAGMSSATAQALAQPPTVSEPISLSLPGSFEDLQTYITLNPLRASTSAMIQLTQVARGRTREDQIKAIGAINLAIFAQRGYPPPSLQLALADLCRGCLSSEELTPARQA